MDVRVSFIVPIYQSEPFLVECLDSLLALDFQERYEVLLLDFGSQDASERICTRYEREHPDMFRFIRCETNYGVSATRNLGLLWARGKYVSFVDSDDRLSKDFLSRLYPLMVKEDLDIVSAGYYLLGKRARRGYSRINRSGDGKAFLRRLYKDPLLKTRTFVWGKLFKASLLKENRIQFPTDLLSFEDLPFYYQCLLAAKRVRYVKTPLYYYRQSSASLTKRTRGVLESHLLAFEKGRDIIQKTDPALFQELFRKKRLAITLQLRYDSHLDIRKGKERAEAKRECRKAVESLFGKEK